MENSPTTLDQSNSDFDQKTISQVPQMKPGSRTKYMLLAVLAIVLFAIVIVGYSLNNRQSKNPNTTFDYRVTPTQTPTISTSVTEPPSSPTISSKTTYTTQLISISYPKDWIHLTNEEYTSFPLIDLLTFPNEINKEIIVLQKDDISLIITMSKADQLEAGGIFSSDQEYSEFIQSHDLVTIQGETYYLSRIHSSLSNLLSAHSGPAAWGVLNEYIPSKMTGSGNIFKGYEQIIKKNGNMYNFIVAGETEAPTPTQLQTEIIEILESIVFIPYST